MPYLRRLGWDGWLSGVNGMDAPENETTDYKVRGGYGIVSFFVMEDRIQAWIDDKLFNSGDVKIGMRRVK